MRDFLTDEQQQVCALLQTSLPSGFGFAALAEEWMWETAVAHKVVSIIAWQAAQQNGWAAVPPAWRQHYEETEARTSFYLAELDRVAAILDQHKIRALLLENGALARVIFPYNGLFTFGDFDLLVSKAEMSEIRKAMPGAGYTLASASDGRLEYRWLSDDQNDLRFNFQTNLVARRWVNTNDEPDFETLWNRSQPIPGSATRNLGPEDFLFQLCVHNASHAYVRKPGIRLHLDVHWYLRQVNIDWHRFLMMVQQYQATTRAYYALLIPHQLFDTPVPPDILTHLCPPAWKDQIISRMINEAGLFNPHERKFSKPGYILFTALLYDDWRGLWRGIFPDSAWMRARYGFAHNWLLPYYHAQRLLDLALRRVNT